jgi:hypothetical protein
MPWKCPTSEAEIRHDGDTPELGRVYRCHVCRLELVLDATTQRLAVVSLATENRRKTVFLGVVTLRLEFIPEALDERQTLTGLLWIRALCHFTDSMRLTGRQSRRRRWLERAVTSAAGV